MPRKPAVVRVQTDVRLPVDLLDRLQAEAERRLVSRNYLIEVAIARLLDDLPALPEGATR